LGRYGTYGKICQTRLMEAMQDSEEDVRGTAAWALGEIGADNSAVPVLIKGLEDKSPRVKKFCALSLGRFGASASESLGLLRQLAASTTLPDDVVRAARTSVQRIEILMKSSAAETNKLVFEKSGSNR
jgi:HEAT repeat protein